MSSDLQCRDSRAEEQRPYIYYDRNAKPLPEINKNSSIRVWTLNGWKPAVHLEQHPLPNSNTIRAGDQGKTYRRNRKHLLLTGEIPHVIPTIEPPQIIPPAAPPQATRPTPAPPPAQEIPSGKSVQTPSITEQRPLTQATRPSRQKKNPVWMKDYTQ